MIVEKLPEMIIEKIALSTIFPSRLILQGLCYWNFEGINVFTMLQNFFMSFLELIISFFKYSFLRVFLL